MGSGRRSLAQRRRFVGLTQESLAAKLGVDRTTVVRWERGDCEPQPWCRRPLAEALDVSLDEVALLLDIRATPSEKYSESTVGAGTESGGDLTDRRTFGLVAALTGIGLSGTLEQLLASPARISADQLGQASALVDRLEQGDAAVGGAAYCDLGVAVHERLSLWQRQASYERLVGDGLQALLGEVECWIGWLALDGERRDIARRYLHDAIVRARLCDDPQLEVRAMVYLSLLIREARPRDSLQCAEAAMRISAAWATPRLTALLHLRMAHALGVVGDAGGFGRHMAKARTQLDRGVADDDPVYLNFVTPMELTGIEGLALLCLDRPDRAADAFRSIAENPAPAYRRNHGYYSVHLAEALCRQGDITEAAVAAQKAVPAVAVLRSPRTHHSFAMLRTRLAAQASRSAAVRDFIAAYDAVVPV